MYLRSLVTLYDDMNATLNPVLHKLLLKSLNLNNIHINHWRVISDALENVLYTEKI